MAAQLTALLKSLGTILQWCSRGYRCDREVPGSRKAVRLVAVESAHGLSVNIFHTKIVISLLKSEHVYIYTSKIHIHYTKNKSNNSYLFQTYTMFIYRNRYHNRRPNKQVSPTRIEIISGRTSSSTNIYKYAVVY